MDLVYLIDNLLYSTTSIKGKIVEKVILGIDIGGTNTVFGLIEKSGNILFSENIPTFGHESADSLVNRLAEKVDFFQKITLKLN